MTIYKLSLHDLEDGLLSRTYEGAARHALAKFSHLILQRDWPYVFLYQMVGKERASVGLIQPVQVIE